MKNFISRWLSVFVMTALCVGFVSCGDDDDDPDVYYPSLDDASSFFVGNWTADEGDYVRYITFSADGSYVYISNQLSYTFDENDNFVTKEKTIVKQTGQWRFVKASENSGLLYTNIGGYDVISIMNMSNGYWYGISTSGYEIRANKMADNDYAINHYKQENIVDYAPDYVTGKHFRLNYSSTAYELYFTSNGSISPASSAGYYVLENATYEKTSASKGKITVKTSGSSYSFYLTFTSESGGTFQDYNMVRVYNFTVDNNQPNISFSAPTSIAYMTFSDRDWRSLTFGSQSGSRVYVSSSDWGSHYSDVFVVTYNRTSSKEATLVIENTYKSLSSSSSNTDTWTYNLTFTSATGGNYSRTGTSTNRYMMIAGMDGTGVFTLK